MKTEQGPTYTAGDVVVVRNLRTDHNNPHSTRITPRVALVAKVLPGQRAAICLHVGGAFRRSTTWAKRSRIVSFVDIVRKASDRERVLGQPIFVMGVAL